MIRVLIAEDQGMVRGALASLLGLEPDIEVVAQVARGDEVLATARATGPDVALLDIEMPGATGLDAAEQLARELPECRVLILTTFGRPGYLRRAMEGGAAGFVLKDAPGDRARLRDPPCAARRAGRRSRTGRRRPLPGREPPDPARARGARRQSRTTPRSPSSPRRCTCRPARSATTSRR